MLPADRLGGAFTPTLALPLKGGERSEGAECDSFPLGGKVGMGVNTPPNGQSAKKCTIRTVLGQVLQSSTRTFYKTRVFGVELFRESALTLVPDGKDVHPVLFRQETIQRDIAGSSF